MKNTILVGTVLCLFLITAKAIELIQEIFELRAGEILKWNTCSNF